MSILNDLKYAITLPHIRGKFENLKKIFYINNKDSMDVNKDFKRYYQEYKNIEGEINHKTQSFLKKIYFAREDDGGLYLKANENLRLSIFLYIPRGINLELKNISINKDSKIEITNIFNIYGMEGFSICLKQDDINVVIEPTSSAGIKGVSSVLLYSLEEDKVIIDNANKYIDCTSILKDYKG